VGPVALKNPRTAMTRGNKVPGKEEQALGEGQNGSGNERPNVYLSQRESTRPGGWGERTNKRRSVQRLGTATKKRGKKLNRRGGPDTQKDKGKEGRGQD